VRGGWSYTGHEQMGARKAAAVLERLKASNADTERVTALVREQASLFPPDAPDAGVRRWLRDVGRDLVHDLFRLRIALFRARPVERGAHDLCERWRHAHAVALAHPPLSVGDLAIDGGDLKRLGLTPGPRFGEVLRVLLDRVIEDPAQNTNDRLMDLARRELQS
jgi:tRNA nucleotidyltransferase (CCA-adding enzyme)